MTNIVIDSLVAKIQRANIIAMQFDNLIKQKELELATLPDVMRLSEEIRNLKIEMRKAQEEEQGLRDTGKQILLDANIKEFKALDGTTVSLHFTPGSLVIEKDALIPKEYIRVKTTEEIDKIALKKAISNGDEFEGVYIQKDCKLVIK